MRRVQFIRGLLVDERPVLDPREYRYHAMGSVMPVPLLSPGGDEEYLLPDRTIETMVVPIHELRGCDKENPTYPPELYIAYSRDVQMLLKMPFDIMKRELEETRSMLARHRQRIKAVNGAGIWLRVRYLFTKRSPWCE